MKLPTDVKTSNVTMQMRIVRIELTTKDWKSPILPLNYIRKLNTQNRTRTYNPFIRSEVLYPIELSVHLRLITRSLFGYRKEEHHLNAPMNNNYQNTVLRLVRQSTENRTRTCTRFLS